MDCNYYVCESCRTGFTPGDSSWRGVAAADYLTDEYQGDIMILDQQNMLACRSGICPACCNALFQKGIPEETGRI